jgi:hypothetical protein
MSIKSRGQYVIKYFLSFNAVWTMD